MTATPSLTGLHDVFYHILSHLTPDPKAPNISLNETTGSKSARKALARLARAHTTFTQPALTVMWRSLPSQKALEHLLCVVGIARRSPPQLRHRPPLEMCGTPATHEASWIRFQEYASRVREIIIDPFKVHSMDGSVKLVEDTFWCQLSSAFGDTPILPRLEGAALRSMRSLSPIDVGVLRLLNPSIRELDITFPRASKGDLKLLRKALTASSFSSVENLEVLSMEVQDLAPVLDMESLPCSNPRLRYLKLDRGVSIKLNHLRPLAALPNLKYLNFSMASWEPPDIPITLPGLCTLAVSCYEFGAIGILLAHVHAPQLQMFSVSETHRDSKNMPKELHNHLRTLVAKCPSITAFEWTSSQVWARRLGYLGARCAGAPLAELITPLLAHRTMRSFSAWFRGPIVPYTRSDFCAIAEAWPDLEMLYLDHEADGDRSWAAVERCADLESVVAFARQCPRLSSLHVPMLQFDPSSPLASELAHQQALARHWLRELFIEQVAVTCSGEQDGDRCREGVVQFRGLMESIFPSAVFRDQYGGAVAWMPTFN